MSTARYRVRTVSRHGVKMLNLNFQGKRCDIVYKERKPIKPVKPKAPPIPEGSSVIISEDGNLIYRIDDKYWTCMLTPNERKLVSAVAVTEEKKLDGKVVFTMFEFGFGDDKLLRNIISGINGKLSRKKIPFRLSFTDWVVRFMEKSGMIEKSMMPGK